MTWPPEGGQVRKDSAAYVSLSSYALVKEHDGVNRRLAVRLSLAGHAEEAFAEANLLHVLHRENRG
jgi:hypothetical protein